MSCKKFIFTALLFISCSMNSMSTQLSQWLKSYTKLTEMNLKNEVTPEEDDDLNNEAEKKLYKEAYEQAPEVIKSIIELLKQKDDLANSIASYYKKILLTGSPGNGKTTLAIAIGHCLVGDDYEFVSVPSVVGQILPIEYLEKIFQRLKIGSKEKKQVLILDQIDLFFDTPALESTSIPRISQWLWATVEQLEKKFPASLYY